MRRGEVVGLVGDNGAGKSTLVKCIAGVLRPSEGEIHLEGTRHEFASPAEALAAGVETVYQDLALVEMFDLTDNLFLGRELVRGGSARALGLLRKREMETAARDGGLADSGAVPGSRRADRQRCPVASARSSRSARLRSGVGVCCSSMNRPPPLACRSRQACWRW